MFEEFEYTPELNDRYLASILNPIEEQRGQAVANARREGEAGGLIAQATTGSRIGAAEAAYGKAKRDAISGFNMQVAGMKRGERLTNEQRAYEDEQRRKTEKFQRELAAMGYAFADATRNNENRNAHVTGYQGLVAGIVPGLASKAIGGYFGGVGAASAARSA